MPVVPYPDLLQHEAWVPQMFDNDGGDQVVVIDRIMRPGVINSVEFVPNWNQTGANTNSRTLTLFNRTSTGTGTTTVAVLSVSSGFSFVKFSAAACTLQSGANRSVAVGDVLEWESKAVGSGLPDVGGLVIVQQSFNP